MQISEMKDFPPRGKVLVEDFFDKGKPLYSSQLGWEEESRREIKTSVSKKIFETYLRLGYNMIFYNIEDGEFYGIHSEENPSPFFRFKKNMSSPIVMEQLVGSEGEYVDTHDYGDGEILSWLNEEEDVWDTLKINGKTLEAFIQHSYIVNIS